MNSRMNSQKLVKYIWCSHGRATPMATPNITKYITILFCLLLILSACSSSPDSSNSASQETPISIAPQPTAGVTPIPTTGPLTDSELAQRIVHGMTLDQKLGQMVIVEFYGSTLNGDLTQMIQGNQVSGVLIENKNGNAQTRSQLVALNSAMQGAAQIPLFISTDFEGGIVNELRLI